MVTLVVKWLINALAIFLVGNFLPGIHVPDYMTALWAALVLSIVNAVIRPILLLVTLPINVITLGLFTFVVNGLMFWFATRFVSGFVIDGFLPAVLGALIVSVIATVLDRLFLGKDGKVGGE
ncbi:MAG TPA: phage holin family protein [Candidatus Paceibacterota bacterium]